MIYEDKAVEQVHPDIAELIGKLDFDPAKLKTRYLAERDKRIRPDGNEQYVEVTADFSRYVDDPYVEPGFVREPPPMMTTLVCDFK